MAKIFLGVPLGEYGHVEDGPIGKHDLHIVPRLLGGHYISRRGIQDRWPIAQLPFLAFGILQSFGALVDSSHFVVLPECHTSTSLLNIDLGRTHRTRVACVVALEILQRAKVLVLDSYVPIPHVRPVGWSVTEKSGFSKAHCLTKAGY
jgi:hypothetical protein